MVESEYNFYLKIFLIIIVITVILLLFNLTADIDDEIFKFYNNKIYFDKFIKKKLLNSEEISQILQEANNYAHINGWTKTRHNNYPTTDNEITKSW